MITFKEFLFETTQSRNLGTLVGSQGGGTGGNWNGSLPKLISLLPIGNWKPTSLKRDRVETRSGNMSDHYKGNLNAYAADFGLNTTFNSNIESATDFAIKIANNAGAKINSWKPYEGKELTHFTNDGFRVQIIWLSNVGGNHYDHVHVGVARKSGNNQSYPNNSNDPNTNKDNSLPPEPQPQQPVYSYNTIGDALMGLKSGVKDLVAGI